MPLENEQLVIEPSYPNAAGLMAIGRPKPDQTPDSHDTFDAKCKVRNSFWSSRWRSDIVIFEKPDGRIDWGRIPGVHGLDKALRTMGCSVAWGIEQEAKAQQLLATLLSHYAFKCYLLTGTFLERSERSGITYFFRKLRPTVAIRAEGETTRILCTLCAHPIGLYANSWAGAMAPSDDVIAHLLMCRADEHFFWKKCNQHPAYRSESGL